MDSSSSELFIEDNDDYMYEDESDSLFYMKDDLQIETNIDFCKRNFPLIKFKNENKNKLILQIYNSFLPKSILHINQFDKNTILCEIEMELKNNWSQIPSKIKITNPTFGTNFIGKSLMMNRIKSFFNSNYKPSLIYYSQNYILIPQITPDDAKMAHLLKLGYNQDEASRALCLMNNNLDQSIRFLETGINTNDHEILDVDFKKYPLFYLILEITEVFFQLSDHCCICGRSLGISGIRPMVCSSKMCNFSFTEIGVGANIIGEIKRDPEATDLLISLASTTYATKFFNPKPPNFNSTDLYSFFQNLPEMKKIANDCENDQELRRYLKNDSYFEILKFLILANKSHIITLNRPEIQIKECKEDTIQFLLTIANPELERKFLLKKKQYGNVYMWHGSCTNRWYSILHSGLKDLGRTVDRVHAGPIYGDGIYQSDLSSYSLGYCLQSINNYAHSELPKVLKVMAMTENAKIPSFKKAIENEYIQPDEEACIVRVLMVVKKDFSWNLINDPPERIPTLNDVLSVISKY